MRLLNSCFMGLSRRSFGILVCGAAARGLPALAPRPKLLVLVVLEQLRSDYLEAAASQFSTGGLRRLLENGAVFHDCRHLASTFPASTLATLATGAWTSKHGIVAERWYKHKTQKTE
jgi:predicted AlkP superfamily pyrophosphatase or phosphodiesterase